MNRLSFVVAMFALYVRIAGAQSCFQTSITAPAPFLGNHGEVFQLADGSFWQVLGDYNYFYEYYPRVIVCPGAGKLSVRGKSLSISMMSPPQSKKAVPRSSAPGVTVVGRLPQCGDWFIAEGPSGYYLLEWYGGYDPSVGDKLAGDIDSFGFKDVLYTNLARDGRVYVDDYMLTRDSVIAKYKEKCR